MNLVQFEFDCTTFTDIFCDFYLNNLIDERVKKYLENGGKVCYSNYYWNTCKNLPRIHNEIKDILLEHNFLELTKKFCESNIWTFAYVGEIITLGFMDDYEQFKNRFIYFDFEDDDLNFEVGELFCSLNKYTRQSNKIFDCYERLTEANAKAKIINSLYNPKTMIGKIHINQLYDENFIS